MKLKKLSTIVLQQAAIALMLVACTNGPDKAPRADDEAMPPAKEIPPSANDKKVSPGNDGKFCCKGSIVSVTDVEVCSRITEQIVMLGADMGQRVKKGQVLVRLDKTDTDDKIRKARAELEQAEYRYQAILMGQGYKRNALDQAPEKLREQARSSSGYNTAKAELNQLEHQLSYCTIVSPVTGVVSHRDAENYTMAVAGKTLFRIIDTDHLKVCFDVLETELHRIAVDTLINVIPISYPEDLHHVRITAVSPLVEQTGMVRMEATLPPHPHFKPGMTVIVTLTQ